MKSIRLLPVVILAVAAMLVLKTIGLVSTGSYVLGGVTAVQAQDHGPAPEAGEAGDATVTLPGGPTMADDSPTLADPAPTLGETDAAGEHGAAPAEGEGENVPDATHGEAAPAAEGHVAEGGIPTTLEPVCPPTDAVTPAVEHEESAPAEHEESAPAEPVTAETEDHGVVSDGSDMAAGLVGPDCVTLVDSVPMRLDSSGKPVPLASADGQAISERALLERLAERRTELEAYERELTLRASLIDAAEKKVAERQATLQALETQIATLVDQRTEMETGQFSGIVTLYENMKPKDAATIFNSLDMAVLLRVAKGMNPRKMSPILAEMDPARAQELTVQMAALADQPAEEMTPDDLAALPQIVGQ